MKPESSLAVPSTASWDHLSPKERLEDIFRTTPADQILITTSLGAKSALLLHLVSQVAPEHPVYFVDTGYHFEETLAYGQLLADRWNLNIQVVKPNVEDHVISKATTMWKSRPDHCCAINKVAPVQRLKEGKTIWVSGLMRYQNANRASLDFQMPHLGLTKVYPFLDLSPDDEQLYQLLYELPPHPLLDQGYDSVGCTHCTQPGAGRSGRWAGTSKTECGLHL